MAAAAEFTSGFSHVHQHRHVFIAALCFAYPLAVPHTAACHEPICSSHSVANALTASGILSQWQETCRQVRISLVRWWQPVRAGSFGAG